MQLFYYEGASQISVLGSEPRWVVGVEITTDYEVLECSKVFEVWIIVWGRFHDLGGMYKLTKFS